MRVVGRGSVSSEVMGILDSVAMFIPGMLRLGPLRLPVYGVFAAVGLIAALWLSQKTAILAGLDAEKLWDAGVFGIAAAFVASRVLLVLVEFPAFLKYPLLVLSMPSLTYGGMVFTGVLVWGWLRWKRLPVLRVLDAWAPCACLLAVVLSLGHFVEGTDAGMPTSLPWGVVTPGDSVLGKVHPVQLYVMVLAMGLCVFAYWMLTWALRNGDVTALTMVAGGMMSFFVDTYRQPTDTYGGLLLDPSQIVGLGATFAGAVVMITRPKEMRQPEMTRAELAELLEGYTTGRLPRHVGEDIEWAITRDPLSREAIDRFAKADEAAHSGSISVEERDAILLEQVRRLRNDSASSPDGVALDKKAYLRG